MPRPATFRLIPSAEAAPGVEVSGERSYNSAEARSSPSCALCESPPMIDVSLRMGGLASFLSFGGGFGEIGLRAEGLYFDYFCLSRGTGPAAASMAQGAEVR